MRTIIRTLAATAAPAALVLGTGASTALAASDPSAPASVARYDFGDSWCFDFGTQVDCTVTDGTLSVTTTPDGREIAQIHFREIVTSFDPDGTQIGTFKTTMFDGRCSPTAERTRRSRCPGTKGPARMAPATAAIS
jgi:hypothetical protein